MYNVSRLSNKGAKQPIRTKSSTNIDVNDIQLSFIRIAIHFSKHLFYRIAFSAKHLLLNICPSLTSETSFWLNVWRFGQMKRIFVVKSPNKISPIGRAMLRHYKPNETFPKKKIIVFSDVLRLFGLSVIFKQFFISIEKHLRV